MYVNQLTYLDIPLTIWYFYSIEHVFYLLYSAVHALIIYGITCIVKYKFAFFRIFLLYVFVIPFFICSATKTGSKSISCFHGFTACFMVHLLVVSFRSSLP